VIHLSPTQRTYVSRVSANGCSINACEVRVQNFIFDCRTSSANVMSRASLGNWEQALVVQPAI
jgi:hypothetical protein